MRKTMKSSEIKTVVVKLTKDESFEFGVDANVFEDIYVEAATRALERVRCNPTAIIRPIIECWEKKDANKPSGYILCNSYWMMVNAAMYDKAERLREKFLAQTDRDLAKEPLRGRKAVKSK